MKKAASTEGLFVDSHTAHAASPPPLPLKQAHSVEARCIWCVSASFIKRECRP